MQISVGAGRPAVAADLSRCSRGIPPPQDFAGLASSAFSRRVPYSPPVIPL